MHLALFAVVNSIYLVVAWPLWLWVTAFWSVGLAVHVGLVVAPAARRRRIDRDPDGTHRGTRREAP